MPGAAGEMSRAAFESGVLQLWQDVTRDEAIARVYPAIDAGALRSLARRLPIAL
jgi:DNA/RNA-binding domain of Phe-tRNA-synthetase-like protein